MILDEIQYELFEDKLTPELTRVYDILDGLVIRSYEMDALRYAKYQGDSATASLASHIVSLYSDLATFYINNTLSSFVKSSPALDKCLSEIKTAWYSYLVYVKLTFSDSLYYHSFIPFHRHGSMNVVSTYPITPPSLKITI